MIKFFRKIRKSLVTENKFTKYLIYAIGEIILVVIGILIALQINNWNTDKVNRKKSFAVIGSINEDIMRDTALINKYIVSAKEEVAHIEKIEKRITKDDINLDSIIHIAKYEFSYFWTSQPQYSRNTYESIIASGYIENIPESLRLVLKSYYDNQEYRVDIINKLNDQYRIRFDDFSQHYSVKIKRIGQERQYTKLENVSWQNVSAKHLFPRFNTLTNAKGILWKSQLSILRRTFNESEEVMKEIDLYLERQ